MLREGKSLLDKEKSRKIIFRDFLGLISFFLMVIGVFYSRALLSIGSGMLMFSAFLSDDLERDISAFYRNKALLALTGVFFIYLISGINSSNTMVWLERLKINLPFLLFPFAFFQQRFLLHRYFYAILFGFWAVTIISFLIILIGYAANFESINEIYLSGKTIPTPIKHVRYALLLVLAFWSGCVVLFERWTSFDKAKKCLIMVGNLFLLTAIHILAVRTGLLALYALLFFLLVWMSWRIKRKWITLLAFTAILFFPLIAYLSLPSLQNKVNYMRWDLEKYFENNQTYASSDYIRLASIQNGLQLMKENPILGVGIGDLKREMSKLYEQKNAHFPASEHYYPINQFVFIGAGAGIAGLLAFVFFLFLPLFFRRHYSIWYFSVLHLILLITFFVESTIALQLGIWMYLFFVLICLARLQVNYELASGAN